MVGDTKYLANQDQKYYKIRSNSDGSVTIDDKTYKNSLSGQRVSGILKASPTVNVGTWDNDYDLLDAELANDYSDSGVVIGEISDSRNHRVAVKSDVNGDVLASRGNYSNLLCWFKADQLVFGGITSLLSALYKAFRRVTSSLEVA